MMSQLIIKLLGAPQIELNGEAVTIRRSKALALLIYLASHGRLQRRDTLATLLWPDSTQKQARSSLRRELSILKKQLGNDCFEIERETLGLTNDVWVDSVQFQRYLAQLPDDKLATIDMLTKAVNLYQNGFLTGLGLSLRQA